MPLKFHLKKKRKNHWHAIKYKNIESRKGYCRVYIGYYTIYIRVTKRKINQRIKEYKQDKKYMSFQHLKKKNHINFNKVKKFSN